MTTALIGVLLALAALPWPEPCADGGTCWLAWSAPTGGGPVEYYEILSGDQLCWRVGQGRQITRRDGTVTWHGPRTVWWPNPAEWCDQGTTRSYQVLACNPHGCSPHRSEAVEWPVQPFTCFDGTGEVPCSTGAAR